MDRKNSNILLDSRLVLSTMRCLVVLCALVAAAAAAGDQGRYDPGRYDPGRYDPGRYDPKKYNSGSYDPGRYDSSKYDASGRWIPDNSGLYNGDRGGSGGQYDGGYGDRGDRGGAGGFYIPEPSVALPPSTTTTTTTTTTPKPKVKPSNYYQYKYGIDKIQKELLSKLNIDGFSNELSGKAFFEYTDSKNEVYRTDYIADANQALTIL